jgi:hypothetical protein
VDQARLGSSFVADQLGKADQSFIQEGSNKEATFQKRARFPTYRPDVLAEMGEGFSLTNRTLVINLPDSTNEVGVE